MKIINVNSMIVLMLAISAIYGCSKEQDSQPEFEKINGQYNASKADAEALMAACINGKVRLDAKPTTDNSFPQDVGYGVIVRVPNCAEVGFDPRKAKPPVKAKSIAFTFLYPDMTLTTAEGTVAKYFAKENNTYVPQKNRFPVVILRMFYVPPDSDAFVPGSPSPRTDSWPRPPRIELNEDCYIFKNGKCNMPTIHIPSGYAGIDTLASEEYAKTHPEIFKHHTDSGNTYVPKPESPYELLMRCDSINCDGYVYSKTYHFEYRMLIPTEAVSHTDELIKAIDKMIAQWVAK